MSRCTARALSACTLILLLTPHLTPDCSALPFGFESLLQGYRHLLTDPEGFTYDIPTSHLRSEYDFIVVGAGPGGATVTNRLTEVPKWSVLLLEAGDEETTISDVPILCAYLQRTAMDWGYRTLPQERACLSLRGRRCAWPRGKVMGGSSVLNYMMYTRGHPKDYNSWEAMGNPGWGWDTVLGYFKKSEDARGYFQNSPSHSTGGYLTVEGPTYQSPITQSFLDSAQEVDLPIIDYNSGEMIGFSPLQATRRNGSRCSASKAFLRPIRQRPNLHVAKNAQVTKVLIDPATKRAYGVEFQRGGRRWSVRARKEVILSAGSINSAQLLLLSGVGPKEHLQPLGIPTLVDLPGVGENLQDHIATQGLTFLVNSSVTLVETRLLGVKNVLDYVEFNGGPLTVAGGVEGIGFIRTPVSHTDLDYPDVEYMFIAGSLAADDGRTIRKNLGMPDDVYDAVFSPINSRDAWTILPMLLQPESRGWVRLRNRNPFSAPLIQANYFSVEHDLDTMVEGIKAVVALSRTRAFQRYGSRLHDIPLPGCRQHRFGTDEYWRCTAQHLTSTIYHYCGTAKMGPSSDPMAVVDPELRVYGVKGLRVVDASIIPRIPAAHTNAPTFMIGEKAADMIKKAYGKH